MTSAIERIVQLPPAAKGALALASGAGILGAARLVLSPTAMYVVALGMVVVALLIVLYRLVLKWLAKRRAAPMAQALAGNAGATPQGISDPARRANLDSMRKSFESGVEKFKAAGKNLYALPWYALVGESGSGKTEAIRHCNVGFPPGLQDQLQGVGGTINMNWWFTNHAVILDTAGRLMFEEVEPGSTNEWQEFLRLLKRHRLNCPINGLLLVIPAESLIRDTADQLEKKGGKIAQQLDNIQRVLGVRFPVFVVITKCDLINGFREFFDTIKDPQLQHQIMGWSNPAELDEPFNPDLVEQHLRAVQQRLQRRRLGLLIDPVHSEDPAARRADQVDALYSFPESLVKIAPRLRRYLEMIFVAGEWSAKPLFLRGIYFTSSMREGSALDADLAEALGRPVEALPEGRIWERDRAYFLRDLFMQKVFKERGLVTRAGNTRQQQRQRRALVLGSAAVGLVLLGLFTWFGWRSLEGSVVGPTKFWKQASELYTGAAQEPYVSGRPGYYYPLVYSDPTGDGFLYRRAEDERENLDTKMSLAPAEQRTPGRLPLALAEQAEARIGVPWVFYPVAALTGDREGDLRAGARRDAARAVFEASVLRPILDVAGQRAMRQIGEGTWSADADAAYQQMIGVELAALERNRGPRPPRIDPLLRYALGGRSGVNDYEEAAKAEAVPLQQAIDRLYGPANPDDRWGGRAALGRDDLIRGGARAFKGSWSGTGGGIAGVIGGLEALEQAEQRLHRIESDAGAPGDPPLTRWNRELKTIRDQAGIVGDGLSALGTRGLREAYLDELSRRRALLQEGLLKDLAPLESREGRAPELPAGSSDADKARWAALNGAREELSALLKEDAAQKGVLDRAPALDAAHLGSGARRHFQSRLAIYDAADQFLAATSSSGATTVWGEFQPALKAVEQAGVQASGAGAGSPGAAPAPSSALAAKAAAASRYVLAEALLARGPGDLESEAQRLARASNPAPAGPAVPMTVGAQGDGAIDPRYAPAAAAAILGDIDALGRAVGADPTDPRAARMQAWRRAGADYAASYLGYWTVDRAAALRVQPLEWDKFSAALFCYPQITRFLEGLAEHGRVVQEAVLAVRDYVPKDVRPDPQSVLADLGTARAAVESKERRAEHEKIFRNWRQLPGAVADARSGLCAAIEASSFADQFVPSAPEAGKSPLGDYAGTFWEDLTAAALESVANGARQETIRAGDEIRRLARFPLVRPAREGGPPATGDDVAAAAQNLAKLPVAAVGKPAPKKINRAKFDKHIDRLFGEGVHSASELEWFRRVGQVLEALPKNPARPFECVVTVRTDPTMPTPEGLLLARAGTLQFLGVAQGDPGASPTPQRYLRDEDRKTLATLQYPGKGLTFGFFTSSEEGQPLETLAFPEPWGILAVLFAQHNGQALAKPLGGGVWQAGLVVEDRRAAGQKQLVWLELKFQKEFPTLDQWADPPERASK